MENNFATKTLILDLDDTIFQTRSMDPKIFEPFFKHLALNLKPNFDSKTIDAISHDLWQNTWDKVIHKYGIPLPSIMESVKLLEKLELNLKIVPYPDYNFIKNFTGRKFLVTTSLTSLQVSKIKALKIENDFEKIVINDTFKETKTKHDIFKELVSEFNLKPETTFVIGDNAASEIEAGNQLNMITIQILREGVVKGNNARYYIKSFEELREVLNKK